tara:strand:- start:15 stop:581 length:567 start_codon:yes stop_codon:yes gene_type:complete
MVEYQKQEITVLDLELSLKGSVKKGIIYNNHHMAVSVYLKDYMTQVEEDLELLLGGDLKKLYATVRAEIECTFEEFETAIFGDGRKKGLAESLWYTAFEKDDSSSKNKGEVHPLFGGNVRLNPLTGEVTISGIKVQSKVIREAQNIHTVNSGLHVRLKKIIGEVLGLGTSQWRTYKLPLESFESQVRL